jgi:cell division septation protein DedD
MIFGQPKVDVPSHPNSLTTTYENSTTLQICVRPVHSNPTVIVKINGEVIRGLRPELDNSICKKYKRYIEFTEPKAYNIEIIVTINNKTTIVKKTIVYQATEINYFSNSTDYLLTIGITNYPNEGYLPNARKDAEAITKVLSSKYQFDIFNTHRLYDSKATKSEIIRTLKDIDKQAESDYSASNLFIYFSGHGYTFNNENYLTPYDGMHSNINTLISGDYLEKVFCEFNNLQNIYIVTDACYSGGLFSLVPKKSPSIDGYNIYIKRVESLKSHRAFSSTTSIGIAGDGRFGENSPFAKQILSYLEDNEFSQIPVNELERFVRFNMMSGVRQIPTTTSINACINRYEEGEFILKLKKDRASVPSVTTTSTNLITLRFIDDVSNIKLTTNNITFQNCYSSPSVSYNKYNECQLTRNELRNCLLIISKAGYESKTIMIDPQRNFSDIMEVSLTKSVTDLKPYTKPKKENQTAYKPKPTPKKSKSAPVKTLYLVQVGLFKNELPKKDLAELLKYGTVYQIREDGKVKYLVGIYSDEQKADYTRNRIKKSYKLYNEAFTVKHKSSQFYSKARKVSFGSLRYKIQLGAFVHKESYSKWYFKEKYKKYGLIEVDERWKNGKKIYVVYLGVYKSLPKAKKDLTKVKKEIPKAFIITFRGQIRM